MPKIMKKSEKEALRAARNAPPAKKKLVRKGASEHVPSGEVEVMEQEELDLEIIEAYGGQLEPVGATTLQTAPLFGDRDIDIKMVSLDRAIALAEGNAAKDRTPKWVTGAAKEFENYLNGVEPEPKPSRSRAKPKPAPEPAAPAASVEVVPAKEAVATNNNAPKQPRKPRPSELAKKAEREAAKKALEKESAKPKATKR